MKISFHGAAQNVTGSCHLLECAGQRILIDCGMYQGGRELTEENAEPFGFEPSSIDFLLLTHAHLDHCGRLPLLVKQGFSGEIITTAASVELARLVLLDAAGLQEEKARYQRRQAKRQHGLHNENAQPLYTTLDALHSFEFFGRKARYDQTLQLAPGISATFIDAGHILGSASVFLELEEDGQHRRLLFSGDIGYGGRAILRDPSPPPEVDTVVIETTYGDRAHKQLQPSITELYDVINETVGHGGNVIIPSFALERAQELLYFLRAGIANRSIQHFITVYLDSPMAISATQIFTRHPECFDTQTLKLSGDGEDPFIFPGLHFTHDTTESMAINQVQGAVILAGSGMCTGGRVQHHLKHNLWNKRNSIVFVGYAAQGTLARRIIDGAEQVKIFGKDVPVRASIHTIGGFSGHADQTDLLAWHQHTGDPKTTFLVHGEERSMRAFAGKLKNTQIEMPILHQEYTL